LLSGLDGRKMSKSYDNTIPLFANEKQLRKLVMKIKTTSLEPGDPKETEGSTLFEIYKAFATPTETNAIEKRYAEGIAWGEMKQLLFEYLNEHIKPARAEFQRLIDNPGDVEAELKRGAEKARAISVPYLDTLRHAVGIRKLG
jgi:tryptophanyl-tRNA synthetase